MHRLLACALLLAALSLASCAVPLGPGFHTEKEFLEVRFVPGAPPHLEVRATFTLKNAGKVPLNSIDFSLPAENYFGTQDLSITVDGAAATPQPLRLPAESSEHISTIRIPFAAPWPLKTTRTVVISYQFVSSPDAMQLISLDASSFHLSAREWHPRPRAPIGIFAKGDAFPMRFDLSVFVPQDFFVHAAGQPRGKRRHASESEFRFRIAEDDFAPFVVAGRYHEQKFSGANSTILFWTFQPLPADQVARAGAFIASAEKTFVTAFGPRSKKHNPIWVAEAGPNLCADQRGSSGPRRSTAAAPETVFLCSPAKLGSGGDAAEFSFADESLAATWFEYVASPRPDLPLPLLPGLLAYAHSVAENGRGNSSFRNAVISSHLADEKNGVTISKLTLFLFALEDELGKETLQHSLRRMIQSLRGRTYSYTDLRVALEAETGKDLGDVFRLWLNQPGIPADFRARYARL